MRKMICVIAAVVLVLTMAIPCFAAEDENSQVQPRSSSVRISGYDPNGNTYMVTGLCSGANTHTAMASTTFRIAGWGEGGGEDDPLAGISQTLSVDATVSFVGLSTTDYDDLDTSDSLTKAQQGEVSDSQYYMALIANVACIHYFSAGGNSTVSIATTG